jgi:hypothetical protein
MTALYSVAPFSLVMAELDPAIHSFKESVF